MAAASDADTLIAAVGHRFWGDRSAGPVWLDRLMALEWPDHVELDDYSFGALAMVQQLEERRFRRALLLTAEVRDDPPASLRLRRHQRQVLPEAEVQAHIAEAGGGVVAIDLLRVVADYFGALPAETWILEVEPADADWGDGLSDAVEACYPQVAELLRSFVQGALDEQSLERVAPGRVSSHRGTA